VAGAVYQLMKQSVVIVRRIDEAGISRQIDGIGRGSITGAVFGGAVEIERGAALPSGDNTIAEFVFINLRRNGRLRISGSVRPSHCSASKTVWWHSK